MAEKILIVDDDPMMLKLVALLVQDNVPYQIVSTNNPLEALELGTRNGFDLVIADLEMPYLDGAELLDALRRAREDVPVIIMAEPGTIQFAMRTLSKGAHDVIIKPVKREQMLFAIDKALKWRRARRENTMLKERLAKACGQCPRTPTFSSV